MVEKHEIFHILKQLGKSPPVQFPETIVCGFGFSHPTFIRIKDSKMQFLEINQSDSKCIGICWNSRKPPFVLKTSSETLIMKDIDDIKILQNNVIFQQFIQSLNSLRISWEKCGIVKIINIENQKIIFDTRNKINKISQSIEKPLKLQMMFIIKVINKALHFTCAHELKKIEIDFIQNLDIFCVGIKHLETVPIFSMHKSQIFPILSLKNFSSVEKGKNFRRKTKWQKRNQVKTEIKGDEYINELKMLNKKMKLMVTVPEIKPINELIEAVKRKVNSIIVNEKLNTSLRPLEPLKKP